MDARSAVPNELGETAEALDRSGQGAGHRAQMPCGHQGGDRQALTLGRTEGPSTCSVQIWG